MATPAQITANRINAESATGPRTPEGKAKSARNALKLGLFSMHDLVHPDREAEYNEIATALWKGLAPHGALQESFATEIVRATWRLQRCAHVEAGLLDSLLETGLDPMQNEATVRIQNAVDRARAQSHSIIRRATAELRRLQTDRQVARETLPGTDLSTIGIASMTEVWSTLFKQFKTKAAYAAGRAASIPVREVEQATRQVHQLVSELHAGKAAKQNQTGRAAA